jgi:hypothetical protein
VHQLVADLLRAGAVDAGAEADALVRAVASVNGLNDDPGCTPRPLEA